MIAVSIRERVFGRSVTVCYKRLSTHTFGSDTTIFTHAARTLGSRLTVPHGESKTSSDSETICISRGSTLELERDLWCSEHGAYQTGVYFTVVDCIGAWPWPFTVVDSIDARRETRYTGRCLHEAGAAGGARDCARRPR